MLCLLHKEGELSIYFEAIAKDNPKMLLKLNDTNWDTKTKHENGRILLHYAALLGKFTSISTLVNNVGVDINTRDENDWTVLHYAVLNKNTLSNSFIYYLIRLGANISTLSGRDTGLPKRIDRRITSRYALPFSLYSGPLTFDRLLTSQTVTSIQQVKEQAIQQAIEYLYMQNQDYHTAIEKTSKDSGLTKSTISRWLSEKIPLLQLLKFLKNSLEQKNDGLFSWVKAKVGQWVSEIGIEKVSKELHIPNSIISLWFLEQRIGYTDPIKLAILKQFMQGKSARELAENDRFHHFYYPYHIITHWVQTIRQSRQSSIEVLLSYFNTEKRQQINEVFQSALRYNQNEGRHRRSSGIF